MAHPDDPEFSCAGTVHRWAQEGHEIVYVLATRGEAGSDNLDLSAGQLAQVREKEQLAAAGLLGVAEVVFLDHPDGSVVANLDLRRDLARQIRRWRPDVVITTDPTVRYRPSHLNHPDHRAVGDAALDAVFPDARNPRQFPELLQDEGLEPHRVQEVYLVWGGTDDEAAEEVDITESIKWKVAALREHASQIRDPDRLEERLREGHRVEDGNGMVRYVERFRRIILR